ncbi:proline iminopeptidase, partial [Phenoliferia sp. Uapishka_3]
MSLYPVIQPYKTELFPVSDLHSLSISQFGNPAGKPVVFVHGGPGGGSDDKDARRFDPSVYRIVLFDQRGSGKSTPPSELTDNTTQHLIEDIEKIRKHLGVENNWDVFGGSWGSTLALAYAQAHPTRVKSLTLRGIFTVRQPYSLSFFRTRSSKSDSSYSNKISFANGSGHRSREVRLRLPGYDCMGGELLFQSSATKIVIDSNHTVFSLFQLHKAWPEAEFIMIPDAGHSAVESGTEAALVAATDKFGKAP